MPYYGTKRKVFISFFGGDRYEVDQFIDTWSTREGVFTPRVLGASDNDDFINSGNPEYVMSQIRQRYLGDSSVTIVLIGRCTHSRRYVDWEIKSSLRRGEFSPNGLVGVLLPSVGGSAHFPQRLADNWDNDDNAGYARVYRAPQSASDLAAWIEDAYRAKSTRAHLIQNSQDMMRYNGRCDVCSVTH